MEADNLLRTCSCQISRKQPVNVSWTYFFFFQAEDGIRDYKVTGVQTCALPISPAPEGREELSACVWRDRARQLVFARRRDGPHLTPQQVGGIALGVGEGGVVQIGRASCRERG